jgi:hypothetical protein
MVAMNRLLPSFLAVCTFASLGRAESPAPSNAPDIATRAVVEAGFLVPVAHHIRFGKDGTRLDYVKDGGQDIFFPTTRWSLELTALGRHTFILLYQPLRLETTETLRQDLVADGLTFPVGTPMNYRYGFDYYRASYLYDFLDEQPIDELALGFSLQIRDADIELSSADGQLRRSRRNVGPVPALKLRGRFAVTGPMWLGFEADGMYAPIKYLNGGRSDVVGAILDASLRAGYAVSGPLDLFINVRYLGGGAEGTSKSDAKRGPGDGYTSNWLHFVTTTVGAELRLEDLLD